MKIGDVAENAEATSQASAFSARRVALKVRVNRSETSLQTADDPGDAGELDGQLRQALDRFDDAGAHAALDRLLSTFALETVIAMPSCHTFATSASAGCAAAGRRRSPRSTSRARFSGEGCLASRVAGGAAGLRWRCSPAHPETSTTSGSSASGSRCARGWRITYLGPDTPLATLTEAAQQLDPALVMLSVTLATQVVDAHDELALLARTRPLAVGGPGATEQLAASIGASFLDGDPVSAAATRWAHPTRFAASPPRSSYT